MNDVDRPLRMALIGGGPGAFIGPVHKMAAELDGQARLVAGAFSRDLSKSREAAAHFHIDTDRAYASIFDLLAGESANGQSIDFIAVTTPNATHFPICLAAIEAGIPVLCDKPATTTLAEALRLRDALAAKPVVYGLTFTYTGYPMLREARALIAAGKLGRVRKVAAEYSQGWLSEAIEASDQKQASWRTDPTQSGAGGCIADIGVHAFNALEFISGQAVTALFADLNTLIAGRRVDDDATVLLRLENGAPGVIQSSQAATGDRNNLRLRVWGDLGGLEWTHERSSELTINWADGRTETLHAGAGNLNPLPYGHRLPTGHPEGFIEAFANIYRDFFAAVRSKGAHPTSLLPGIDDGVRAMAFIEQSILSSQSKAWVPLSPGSELLT